MTPSTDERLARLAEIARQLDDPDLGAEALSEQDRLQHARFFTACIGQFKRGKSTLVNALVGEPVLPVGAVPVTSVVTILCYADTPGATVRLASGESIPIPLDAVGDIVDERRNPGNRRHAVAVEIGLPCDLLREGLCLVDTPGLGSIHAANTDATRAFVPRIDAVLAVVGPDPPLSGAELETIRETVDKTDELAVIMNKADLAQPGSLDEILDFTRAAVASAVGRTPEHVFTISALERTTGAPTRDWSALEDYLRRLSTDARSRLVARAAGRAMARIARRAAVQIAEREHALRRPIAEAETRAARLRQALADIDRARADLRFRFDAAEADLGTRFERQRLEFVREAAPLARTLGAWIEANGHASPLRARAFEEAHRLATNAIDRWLDRIEPEANALYGAAVDRFVAAANESIGRVAADAADLDAGELPAETGFHLRRQFYFTHLMHATGATPVAWIVDHTGSRRARLTHVTAAATAYLERLLQSNSHRVENDFRDRTRESRRWLEARIQTRLTAALASADRALAAARTAQRQSEAAVGAELGRLHELRTELVALG